MFSIQSTAGGGAGICPKQRRNRNKNSERRNCLSAFNSRVDIESSWQNVTLSVKLERVILKICKNNPIVAPLPLLNEKRLGPWPQLADAAK
jgi:hypothetical protein